MFQHVAGVSTLTRNIASRPNSLFLCGIKSHFGHDAFVLKGSSCEDEESDAMVQFLHHATEKHALINKWNQ